MYIVITTYGTTGDVQPLLGLGVELRDRGHSVTFGAPPGFSSRARQFGLDFVPLGPQQDDSEFREVYGLAALAADPVQQVRRTLALAIRDAPQMVAELTRHCSNADVIISLPFQVAGPLAHELSGIPLISVNVSPFTGYSRRFAQVTADPINALRASYGLQAVSDPLGPEGGSKLLSLCAVSPLIFPRPRHWPSHCHLTGFWFLEEEFTPDSNLTNFIAAGEPPIAISFGSMVHLDPQNLVRTLVNAVQRTGRRAVIQRGWSKLDCAHLPESICAVDFLPHRWLFPRCACVVHAGGAGTTAATLRAGTPSVVVPHILDQFIWGALLQERGCSADTIPFRELTAERLAAAIQRAVVPELRVCVSKLSRDVGQECGTRTAASLIEIAVASAGTTPKQG